jgi:hypothetical protein
MLMVNLEGPVKMEEISCLKFMKDLKIFIIFLLISEEEEEEKAKMVVK